MKSKLERHIEDMGIVEADDGEGDKPIFRRPGFEGVVSLTDLEKRIGEALRQARDKTGLTHADVAPMLGLHPQVYGRYERGESKLNVSRLIQLSELLNFSPLDVLLAAAPYRFGETSGEADQRARLMQIVETLPPDAVTSLLSLVEAMKQMNAGGR
ncbi:transcriptional regulator [Neorhizobium sp. NCHU2750]|uniref:helix-turn-helix domain-containing protein n=1 Tax=Neorhizobium sp. NCHU2750 TaxID=1825976 RepID=UPI000E71B694|nr:hypothetical protein NCHU2750_12490 [Neorhizobium sp. NCHU2750]